MDKQAFVLKSQIDKSVTNIFVNVIRKHGDHLLLLLKYRAFEERRKQEEEKEQRFREQILQQRKIKLQEATNRFLRAHLPLSQHNETGL